MTNGPDQLTIYLDGPHKSGKSTQVELVCKLLSKCDVRATTISMQCRESNNNEDRALFFYEITKKRRLPCVLLVDGPYSLSPVSADDSEDLRIGKVNLFKNILKVS